jgi:hypothetical protein
MPDDLFQSRSLVHGAMVKPGTAKTGLTGFRPAR